MATQTAKRIYLFETGHLEVFYPNDYGATSKEENVYLKRLREMEAQGLLTDETQISMRAAAIYKMPWSEFKKLMEKPYEIDNLVWEHTLKARK